MFNLVIKYIERTSSFSEIGLEQLKKFTELLIQKTEDIERVFDRVRTKYNFEALVDHPLNRYKIKGKEFYYNRIGFWMDRYEFGMSIGIEEEMDDEFMLIIDDSEIFIEYSEEISDEERDHVFNVAFKIFGCY